MGTIAFCKYNQETVDHIHDWCIENNIPNPTGKSKIHTTVLWSRADVPRDRWVERDASHFRKMKFRATSLDLFDHWSKREEKFQKCLVVKIDAPYLVHCHHLLKKHGGVHDFLSYDPHITVCYNMPIEVDISKIPVPSFDFCPNKIFTESFVPPKKTS